MKHTNCERTTCTECVCRVPAETVNNSGVCVTCQHFADIEPRLTEFARKIGTMNYAEPPEE